jgi:HAE1 family hydrophobic/amphiphilic exporter-1
LAAGTCLCALTGRAFAVEPPGAASPTAAPVTTPPVSAAPAAAAAAAETSPAAEKYEEPEFIREPPRLPEGMDLAAARRLPLRDALALALANNLGIVLVKQQVAIAEQGVEQSLGLFEPTLTASYSHQNADAPPDPAQGGLAASLLESTNDRWIAGYGQRIRLGTQLELQWINDRTKSRFDTGVEPLFYRSELRLALTQPLLRGFAFRWEVPNADVLRAEVTSERARQDYKGRVIATVRDTEDAYWDLVQALQSYQVQLGSLNLAREQLGLTGRQIEAGLLPPSDLINAEGTLAQRQLGLVQAEATVEQSADQLRHLLNLPREAWSAPILPLDAPEFDQLSVTFEAALNQALQNRPELEKLKLDLRRAALDLRVASSDRLPQLDASVSYGLVGQRSQYPDSVNQLFSADARAWSAILNFSWTPLNQTARAKLTALRLSERSLRTLQDQTLLDLRLELRTAIRGLETADRSVRAAGKFRSLAERSLDAEQRKFLNGTSNNFFVAQRQDDLSRARLAELSALIQHRKAATALRAAMGVLLEHRHVQLDVRGPSTRSP